MRTSNILIGFFLSVLVGCQAMPHPAPGLSAVQVKVIAEPKAGVISSRVSTYDQSSGSGYGDFERVDYSDLHDIVVWLELKPMFIDIPLAPPPPPAPLAIDLSGRAAPPGLTAVASAGQKLICRNTGGTPLSAYCVSDGNEFNLGTIPPGGRAEATVKSPGLIEILSDSIQDPLARIYAAPTHWVVLTHCGATVDFNNLRPDHYQINSWHPRLPGATAEVTLLPDQVARVSIVVGVNRLPKIDSK